MQHIIAPSILSANFSNLESEIQLLNNSAADWIHVDVMDGVFVPNISFGFPIMKALTKHAKKPLDVHLMIEAPDKYIEEFAAAGADRISVHYEACPHLHRVIQTIKNTGKKCGVAINPHTSINLLEPIIQELDQVIVMSVNPGFGGQKFIKSTIDKIIQLNQLLKKKQTNCIIEVDGGITTKNADGILNAGASALVAGSFVFNSENPKATIQALKDVPKTHQ